MTLAEQFLLDSEVTGYVNGSKYVGSPLQYVLQNDIQKLISEREDQSEETLLDISDDIFQPDVKHHDVKQKNLLLNNPRAPKELSYSVTLQHWIGHVESISDETFTALLKDQTNGGTDELATIDIVEVPVDDVELLSVGAAFYWTLSYSYEKRQIKKESSIRFQRIVHLTNDEFDSVADGAENLFSGLNIIPED